MERSAGVVPVAYPPHHQEQDGKERVEGPTTEEMDILKDLPSYNSSNFSRLLPQGASSNPSPNGKNNSVRMIYHQRGILIIFCVLVSPQDICQAKEKNRFPSTSRLVSSVAIR